MEKIAFKMKLKPGMSAEYKRRHDAIWPELITLLRENGVSDYSIFLDEETDTLFAVQYLAGHSSQELGKEVIVQQWWARYHGRKSGPLPSVDKFEKGVSHGLG